MLAAELKQAHWGVRWWVAGLIALAPLAAVGKMGGGAGAASSAPAMARLPLQAQGVISTAVGATESKFDARRTSFGYRLAGGGVVAELGRRGAELRASGGSVSFSLGGIGRGGQEGRVPAGLPVAQSNRVVIDHGGVSEWYAAGPLGIDQGFTVVRRPAGAHGAVTLSLIARGSLEPQRSGAGFEFVDRAGDAVLQYGGVTAVDASGRKLPATLVAHGGRLLLSVLDQGARYPLRIDPFVQQGPKLTGSGVIGQAGFGWTVALSSDGNTALVGGMNNNGNVGAAWVFTRANGVWTEQGELVGDCTGTCSGPNGTGEIGAGQFGGSVALSADGNTALIGAHTDNNLEGAAWVFTRSGSDWSQQAELVGDCVSSCAGNGTGEVGDGVFGLSVALAGNGNEALIGAPWDSSDTGAGWLFTRSGGSWSQLGSKLVGGGEVGPGQFGRTVALSSDGTTALVGGQSDKGDVGAAWVFGGPGGSINSASTELIGSCTGVVCLGTNGTGESGAGEFGSSVALSSDGTTALIGGFYDNTAAGAAWVFANSGGAWAQQGPKLTAAASGEIGAGYFGWSGALSSDGNTALIGGQYDNNAQGAAWAFTRSGGVWSQTATKLVGDCTGTCSGPNGTGQTGKGWFGQSVALSADASTALIGGPSDNNGTGAAWVFGPPPASPPSGSGSGKGPSGGSTGAPVLTCTVESRNHRVAARKRRNAPGMLSLIASCNQTVRGILVGDVTEYLTRHRTRVFTLRSISASLPGGVREVLKLRVPATLVQALKHGVRESVALTLTVSDRTAAAARVRSLQL